ncbi:MAG: fimbrillin family protein [Phocaeicola sp.]
MKLKNLLGAALVLPAMIGAGCSAADENLTCGCDNELTFRATVAEGAARAIGTAWSKGDAVGLFMVNGGSGLATGNLVNNVANYKYVTVEGDGNFEAQSISHLAYYPADGSAVDFVAYYPYQSNLSGFNYAVNVTDQSNPEAIDLLYSNDAKGMSHDSNASMMFHHKLTRMVLTIKEMNGSNLVEGVQVSLNGMHTQGTFALADATLALTSGSKADVAAKMYAQTSGAAQAELIMLPEVAEAGASLTFTHPTAGTFVHAFQVGEEFKTGTQVNIEVILSGSGSDNKVVVLSSNITPWEEVDGGKIDVDFGGTTDEATLAVNPSAVSFEAAGGTKTVAVTVTNQGDNAISISSLSGILSATLSGNTITVTAAENTTATAVSQSLTVSLTNGASVVVPVTVAGKDESGTGSTFTVTAAQIAASATGSVSLGVNKYDSQLVATPSTWYTWATTGVDFTGVRICVATEANGGGIQMQGNATDVAKQGRIANATPLTGLKKMTLVFKVVTTSDYDPGYNVYAGTAANPSATKIALDNSSVVTEGGFRVYTQTYDFSAGNYSYFTIMNDLVGALYLDSMEIVCN